jgi:fatty-acyl-CoA synthase
VIKSGGEWISSKDLELHVAGLPSVAMAAVVASPHPKWDERPVCVIIAMEGMTAPTLDEVKAHCLKDGMFAKVNVLSLSHLNRTLSG